MKFGVIIASLHNKKTFQNLGGPPMTCVTDRNSYFHVLWDSLSYRIHLKLSLSHSHLYISSTFLDSQTHKPKKKERKKKKPKPNPSPPFCLKHGETFLCCCSFLFCSLCCFCNSHGHVHNRVRSETRFEDRETRA